VKDHPAKDLPMQKNVTLKSLNLNEEEDFDIRQTFQIDLQKSTYTAVMVTENGKETPLTEQVPPPAEVPAEQKQSEKELQVPEPLEEAT